MSQSLLTIGITTFNRRSLLEATACSLSHAHHLERARIWVLDDCSHEFDVEFLKRIYPCAEIFRAEGHSGGADQAMHRLFERFVASGSGYLLNLDADLLVSPKLIETCVRIIDQARHGRQRCLYSLFNTDSHPVVAEDGEFLLKHSVGAAGTLWDHGLLVEVLQQVPVSTKFDWDWSALLTRQAVPIRVTRRSYVQHIGRIGQHSRSLVGMDHGIAFDGYEGPNLAAFLDHNHDGLLQAIADHKTRLNKHGEATIQLTEVVQSQARLINELIGEIGALEKIRKETLPGIAAYEARLNKQGEAIVQLSQVVRGQAQLINELIAEISPREAL